MPTKSVDLAQIRSVVLAGHAGSGKTTLAENLLFKTGALARLGRVDDGTAALDFEPEEQKRRESLSAAVATFDDDGTIVTLVDTPGYPDFVGRGDLRHGRLRRRAPRRRRHRRGRGRSRGGRRPGSIVGPGGRLLHQQERPRERRPECDPRCAPDRVRAEDRAAPPGHRGRRDVQRLRRPRPPEGVAVGRQAGSRDRDPGRARSRGRHPARSAPRGSRRGRRRRPYEVPRGRGDQRPGARGVPPQGRQGVDPRPGPRRQCHQGDRPARAARRVHPLSARHRPTSRPSSRASRSPATKSGSSPTRPGRSSSGCSRPRRTRTSAG